MNLHINELQRQVLVDVSSPKLLRPYNRRVQIGSPQWLGQELCMGDGGEVRPSLEAFCLPLTPILHPEHGLICGEDLSQLCSGLYMTFSEQEKRGLP